MKIHMLYEDVNKFQMLAFEGMEQLSLEELTFDGRPRLAHWKPPGAFVYKPRLKRGNFLALGGCSTFVVDATAAEELADLLEESGELLRTSCRFSGATKKPRLGSLLTRPSLSRRSKASRTGVR